MFVACVREVGEREGSCWQLGTTRKFTATSRVVKGKINTTDTRGAECGLGTAIQAHCSDQVPAELMGLTASRVRERERGGGGRTASTSRFRSAALRWPYVNEIKCVRGEKHGCMQILLFSGSVWRSAGSENCGLDFDEQT